MAVNRKVGYKNLIALLSTGNHLPDYFFLLASNVMEIVIIFQN
jgi:hypothetical protein